jgi:hypothetical protein
LKTYVNCLQADEYLPAGSCIYTVTNDYKARYMASTSSYPGKLCIYSYDGLTMYWCSTTGSTSPSKLLMQNDGNLVMYNSAGTAYWSSGTVVTSEGTSYYFVFQADRNIVIYDSISTKNSKWACNTQSPACTIVSSSISNNECAYFPSYAPTAAPSLVPSQSPTMAPTVSQPPTLAPTVTPTAPPTSSPSASPTLIPTVAPSQPTHAPTAVPTRSPTDLPTVVPTQVPTTAPTVLPTQAPTASPSLLPTNEPTAPPTRFPTAFPTNPTYAPTASPSFPPTIVPSVLPSVAPSNQPSEAPTIVAATAATAAGLGVGGIVGIVLAAIAVAGISAFGVVRFWCNRSMKIDVEAKIVFKDQAEVAMKVLAKVPMIGPVIEPLTTAFETLMEICDQVKCCRETAGEIVDRTKALKEQLFDPKHGILTTKVLPSKKNQLPSNDMEDEDAIPKALVTYLEDLKCLLDKTKEDIQPLTQERFWKILFLGAKSLNDKLQDRFQDIDLLMKRICESLQIESFKLQRNQLNQLVELQNKLDDLLKKHLEEWKKSHIHHKP